MKNNAISNENSDDDTADGNENDLIVIEESTKFFSASSAWARYSDGLEHNFLPPDMTELIHNMTLDLGMEVLART